MAGVTVVPVTAKIENGFALPDVEAFEDLINEKTKGIVICNPGNPTGYLYKQEELEQLRDIVLKHDLFLFADEVYREFCYDGAEPFSVLNLNGLEQNVILVDSVSKRYSMCGARIGAMITKNEEVRHSALKFAQARLSPPSYGQEAGEAALRTPDAYFEEVQAEYVKRRDLLVDGLNAIEGVICPKPSGAFYCIAQLPIDDSDRFCQWMLEVFDWKGRELGLQQVRLAYVLNEDALKDSIEILREALATYPGKLN